MHKQIPKELRLKIMSYLDYLQENKKMFKLDEQEVLAMLNETLREQVIVHLNGKML